MNHRMKSTNGYDTAMEMTSGSAETVLDSVFDDLRKATDFWYVNLFTVVLIMYSYL